MARLEQKQEVNYFAPQRKVSKDKNKKQERVFHAKRLSGLPQGTADKDNECSNSFVDPNMPKDLDRNYKLAPAVLMGSAFDRMHSTEFYKSVGVCERCFLAYDKITQQRDQVTAPPLSCTLPMTLTMPLSPCCLPACSHFYSLSLPVSLPAFHADYFFLTLPACF